MEQTNVQITQNQPTLVVEIVQNLIPVMTAQVVVGGGGGSAQVVFGDTMTGTGTPSDPVNVSNDILGQLNDNSEQIQDNARQIADIQDVIPATANSQNQLADQGFVNSSIQTATAYFRGDWATWADVPTDPAQYPADATGNRTPITNDYMVVIADEQENGGTWRYKYTGTWATEGKSGWQAEYQVNETPFTAAQNAAINSGITAQAVADIATNKSNITALQNSKQDKLTAGTGITIEGNTISADGAGGLPTKQDIVSGVTYYAPVFDGTSLVSNNGFRFRWYEFQNGGYLSLSKKNASSGSGSLCVGIAATINGSTGQTAVGHHATTSAAGATAIGWARVSAECALHIGSNYLSTNNIPDNNQPGTFMWTNNQGSYVVMDANGNVPLERLTYVTNQIGDISTALSAIIGE